MTCHQDPFQPVEIKSNLQKNPYNSLAAIALHVFTNSKLNNIKFFQFNIFINNYFSVLRLMFWKSSCYFRELLFNWVQCKLCVAMSNCLLEVCNGCGSCDIWIQHRLLGRRYIILRHSFFAHTLQKTTVSYSVYAALNYRKIEFIGILNAVSGFDGFALKRDFHKDVVHVELNALVHACTSLFMSSFP